MSNQHRIKWIDRKIRNMRYPNCRSICEEFEISNRQALRDIEYLKNSLNAPIEYSQKYKGYFYTEKTYGIPFEMITRNEGRIISKVIHEYKGGDSDQIRHLSTLFSEIDKRNNNEEKITKILDQGIKNTLKVEIKYVNKKNVICREIIKNHKIIFTKWGKYLEAFTDSGSKHIYLPIRDLKSVRLTGQCFNRTNPSILYKSKDIIYYKCRIEIDDSFDSADYEYGITTFSNIIELDFESSDQLLSYLLMKGTSFKILSPGWLKDKLLKKLRKIIEKNTL